LDVSHHLIEANLKSTKDVPFKHGLGPDKAKTITKLIRNEFPKVKLAIQGDAVRVTGSSKDELQNIIQFLKSQEFDYPINFLNFR
jgi:cyclic-di-GMP-binding protein